MTSAVFRSVSKFFDARSYTWSAYGSTPAGSSSSARETRRKLSGLPSASARASSVLTTSYGTAAISAALEASGRSARNGTSVAMALELYGTAVIQFVPLLPLPSHVAPSGFGVGVCGDAATKPLA
jgi:hypothetical protein